MTDSETEILQVLESQRKQLIEEKHTPYIIGKYKVILVNTT
jgi:hypothetical protein